MREIKGLSKNKLGAFLGVNMQNEENNILMSTNEMDYKQILLKRGLIDEKENITEEDAKKLIDFAIANKEYIIKKEDKKA